MHALIRGRRAVLPVVAAFGIVASLAMAHGAVAQSATGTVTGRVLWGICVRAIPLPMQPDAQGQAAPDGQTQTAGDGQSLPGPDGPAMPSAPDAQMQPAPGSRPIPGILPIQSGLPAGAVLVAVQNTGISARTDETGRFTLSSVPAGQYLTVAAGPVANAAAAIAGRPNVYVSGGQSLDIGTLSLGGSGTGTTCFPIGVQGSNGGQLATPSDAPTSPADAPIGPGGGAAPGSGVTIPNTSP